MNRAWHARRAKREIRQGGDITAMPHFLQLTYRYGSDLAWNLGFTVRLVLNEKHSAIKAEDT